MKYERDEDEDEVLALEEEMEDAQRWREEREEQLMERTKSERAEL